MDSYSNGHCVAKLVVRLQYVDWFEQEEEGEKKKKEEESICWPDAFALSPVSFLFGW